MGRTENVASIIAPYSRVPQLHRPARTIHIQTSFVFEQRRHRHERDRNKTVLLRNPFPLPPACLECEETVALTLRQMVRKSGSKAPVLHQSNQIPCLEDGRSPIFPPLSFPCFPAPSGKHLPRHTFTPPSCLITDRGFYRFEASREGAHRMSLYNLIFFSAPQPGRKHSSLLDKIRALGKPAASDSAQSCWLCVTVPSDKESTAPSIVKLSDTSCKCCGVVRALVMVLCSSFSC